MDREQELMKVVVIHKDGKESPIWVSESSKQETIDLVKGWYDQGWIMGWELRGAYRGDSWSK